MYNDIKNTLIEVNKQKKYSGFSECVKELIDVSTKFLLPGFFGECGDTKIDRNYLDGILKTAFSFVMPQDQVDVKKIAFVDCFADVFDLIVSDIQAAYNGDPASKSYEEIILTYPFFKAITAYRFAHILYQLDVPILPRAISEHVHSQTGIDIHPGATIGKGFFVDHGTGVVIGETAVIGDNVTIYQNVTLGAKSFPQNTDGSLVKGIKRHPNIGNNVVIYAGATILGNVIIGDNCTIGGNVWLTHSVEPNQKITI